MTANLYVSLILEGCQDVYNWAIDNSIIGGSCLMKQEVM